MSETTAERARASAPTLHDVARSAGVSLATASRVLNGSTRKVAEAYRERVEAAAAELGYTANLSAQATARGTSAIIALLVADIADPYFAQIAAGVARGADEAGLVVTIAITERDPAARSAAGPRAARVSGRAASSSRRRARPSPPIRWCRPNSTRSRRRAAGSWLSAPAPAPCDRSSSTTRSGARDLGRALGERGYRNAIVLAAGEGVLTSDDRTAGFTEGFAAAGGVGLTGLPRRLHPRVGSASSCRRRSATASSPAHSSSRSATSSRSGRCRPCARRAARSGSDIALCGFDDIPAGRDVTPGLTTVNVPLDDVGYLALRAAVDEEWDADAGPLPLAVVLRDSTPPVSGVACP